MDELAHAGDTLSALVRDGFGPSADETLLFAPPDVPVVCADGRALLAAWRRGLSEACVDAAHSAPMQTAILDAAEGLSLLTGDGSTAFVLLLHSAIRRALDAARDRRHADTTLRQLTAAFGDVKRECAALLHDSDVWCPGLRVETSIHFERASGSSDATALKMSDELHNATVCILESGLTGLLGAQALAFLIDLVLEWLFTPVLGAPSQPHDTTIDTETTSIHAAQQVYKRIQRFLAHANDAIVFALAPSLGRSQVVSLGDFVLRKSLVPAQLASFATLLSAQTPLRFVGLTCALSLTTGANAVTIRTTTQTELLAAAAVPRAFVIAFVTSLRVTHGVQLIVTTEALDDAVVATCSRLGVACVQLAERSDVFVLCAAAGVAPLASVLDTDVARHVSICSRGVSSVRLQQSACLWFHGLAAANGDKRDGSSSTDVVPQLLLHAPSRGVFKQYAKTVVKALRILGSWYEPLTRSTTHRTSGAACALVSCRGGGATELALAAQLTATSRQSSTDSTCARSTHQLARGIVADALRDVVVMLHRNLHSALSTSVSSASVPTAPADPAARTARRAVLQDAAMRSATRAGSIDTAATSAPPQPFGGYILDTHNCIATLLGAVRAPALHVGDPLAFGLLHPWRRIDALLTLALETLERLLRVDSVLRVRERRPDHGAALRSAPV